MFKINRRTDYAIRVGVALAKRPAGTRLATRTIQAEMLIPRPFLQRIIAELCQAGLLLTYPGPSGGIQLARPANQITLQDIVAAMDGPLCISDCISIPGDCPLGSACPVRKRWGRLQTALLNELARTSLLDLAQEALGSGIRTGDSTGALFSSHFAEMDAQVCTKPTN